MSPIAFNMKPYMKKYVVSELEFRFGNGRSRNEMVYEAFKTANLQYLWLFQFFLNTKECRFKTRGVLVANILIQRRFNNLNPFCDTN